MQNTAPNASSFSYGKLGPMRVGKQFNRAVKHYLVSFLLNSKQE